MSGTSSNQQIARLIEFANLIENQKQVSLEALTEHFQVPDKHIFTYIQQLNQAGIPVDLAPNGYSIPKPHAQKTEPLTSQEIVLLSIGLKLLRDKGVADWQQCETIFQKLLPNEVERKLLETISESLRTEPPVRSSYKPRVMGTLYEAITKQRRIKMKYHSVNSGEVFWRELSPYTLVHRRESWYVAGYCHLREEVRTFKVDRIQDLKLSDQPFYQEPDFHPDDYLAYQWSIFNGQENLVVARFYKEVGDYIREKQLTQGRIWPEKGYVYLQTVVASLEEFSWWIMQYGEHAEVLQPEELRRMLAKRTAKMAEIYSDAYHTPKSAEM